MKIKSTSYEGDKTYTIVVDDEFLEMVKDTLINKIVGEAKTLEGDGTQWTKSLTVYGISWLTESYEKIFSILTYGRDKEKEGQPAETECPF